MNYQDWITELSVLLPQPLASGAFNQSQPFLDSNYNTVIPRAIEYAENLIYRDPDMIWLQTRKTDHTGTTTTGTRSFTIPGDQASGGIEIVESLALITPSGQSPETGTRVGCLPVSIDFINFAWPQASVTQAPSPAGPGPYFAMLDNQTAVIAPTPDAAYTVEVTGIYRPASLQMVATSETYLTDNFPDLFTAASMIYWTGVMKDWGAQSDDPRMAMSWTTQYETIKKGVTVQTARQAAQGPGWTPFQPTTIATPPRN